MAKMTVTPWEVKGDIDYGKLIKAFGVKPLKKMPEMFLEHVLFRREFTFAHRDIGLVFDCIRKGKPFNMMTGCMPTGKFHLGHLIVAQQIIHYQKLGAHCYIAIADVEAYHSRGQSLEESRKNAIEQYVKNYIALGLKPKNCEIYFQSNRSKDSGKANSYYRLQNLLASHATFNEFKAVYGDINPGKMLSAIQQAADMLHPQLSEFSGVGPTIVPVGIDQDPHLRLARDMSKRIKVYRFTQLTSSYHRFIPGLGGGKMSSSDPNSFIAMTDDAKTVKKKINKYAFSGGKETLEEHRKKGGNPHVDVAYQYLTLFEHDDKKLKKMHDDYVSGKLLSGEMKALAIEKINAFLKDHQKKLAKAGSQLKKFGF
ncbi:MAG: tryptophan--tRNA ligase [Candidatus Nanoarchaeia archaeon]